jgi:uncharacterized protein (TIGR03086 family)
MSEVADRYGRIADGFQARLSGVGAGQWAERSPCAEWTARDVAVHVIVTHRRVMTALDGTEAAEIDPDVDLREQWTDARAAIAAAVDDPDRAATTVGGMFGEQSFESLVSRLLCADTMVHTWDLARATGQDDRLDPQGVTRAMDFLGPIDEAIRRPGGFAAKIEPAPGADEQTRLLNFCGRAV